MNRDDYVKALKDAAVQAGVKLVMEYLIGQLPFFGLFMVKGITTAAVGWVLETAVKFTEFGAFFLYIDLRTSAEGRAFEKAAMKNFEAQKDGTDEEKQKAESDLISAFRNLVKLSN